MSVKAVGKFDPQIYEQYGHEIGRATAHMLTKLQNFVTFMKTQKLTSHEMNQAASAMYTGLCQGIASKSHAKNLRSLVWSVLKRKNFNLLCLNHSENLRRNLNIRKTDLRSCIDQLQISDSDSCKSCGDGGCLIICEKCQFGWHYECAPPDGLLEAQVTTIRKWYCHECVQSGSEIQFYKKPRRQPFSPTVPPEKHGSSLNKSGTTCDTSAAVDADAAAAESISAVAETALLVDSATNISTQASVSAAVSVSIVTSVAAASTSTTVHNPGFTSVDEAPASCTAASTLTTVHNPGNTSVDEALASVTAGTSGTAKNLSERMAFLSMQLLQVAKPSEQVYQTYLSDIERFLSLISQQLAADSASVRTGIQALPSFCKESMTADVQSQSPGIEMFGECMADNHVGACQVFRVYTTIHDGSHPYDSIALEIDKQKFYVNNRVTSGNKESNTVTISEPGNPTNSLTFSGVSADFLSWALAKMTRNYQIDHFNFFEANSMVRVDCGARGNCFFHSCLFLLKLEVPDFTFTMAASRTKRQVTHNISQATHAQLREATCQHLRNHYAEMNLNGYTIVDTLRQKDEDADEAIIKRFCAKNEKLGEFAERTMVMAFAHFCQVSIPIYHISHHGPYNVGVSQPVRSFSSLVGLFCDEQHYQARVIHISMHIYSTFSRISQAVVPANKIFKQGDTIVPCIDEASLW